MVSVLITGAAGFIAHEVAQVLAASGHNVYGLVRKQSQAEELKKLEVIPIIGSVNDLPLLESIMEKVELLIDTVTLLTDSDPSKSTRDLLALCERVAARTQTQKRFIYTSGILTYGDYPDELVDESRPSRSPMLKWRVELEQFVIQSSEHPRVHGIVIRPGFVYGKSGGSIVPSWFQFNDNGDFEFRGSIAKRWSTIHISDLAAAFAGLTDANSSVNGEIFDCVDFTRLTAAEIRTAFARRAGAIGSMISLPAGNDYFSTICECSCVSSSDKLRRFIGWFPRHLTILDHLDQLYSAVKAHHFVQQIN